MKKLTVVVILIAIIILGGYFVKSNVMIDKKVANKAKIKVEDYIRKNYEGIETVEFTDVSRSPLGGLMVDGIVNGKAGFSASVDDSSDYYIGSIGEEEGFPPEKEECVEKVCE
ncbi:DUF1433 domain-containing protein [Numidum massiliense]|uniref:DUF1433 domain-containing protein n=1 Tax=Numidum massiliense TaxID=1522315 RepID=UPI0006D53003|nr:DUF1433 domain-containing protein [Numidum massiliense]